MNNPACNRCNSTHTIKSGTQEGIQRYKCKDCNRVFRFDSNRFSTIEKMKILMMHINLKKRQTITKIKEALLSYLIGQTNTMAIDALYSEINNVRLRKMPALNTTQMFSYYIKEGRLKRAI